MTLHRSTFFLFPHHPHFHLCPQKHPPPLLLAPYCPPKYPLSNYSSPNLIPHHYLLIHHRPQCFAAMPPQLAITYLYNISHNALQQCLSKPAITNSYTISQNALHEDCNRGLQRPAPRLAMCYGKEVATAMGGETARDVVTSEGVHSFQRRNTIGWAMGGEMERASDIIGRFSRDCVRPDQTEMRWERHL